MTVRSNRLGWLALALLVAGLAALAVGLSTLGASFDGGYNTYAVGAPAYAGLFTVDNQGRSWLVVGTALIGLGGAGALALGVVVPRTGARPWLAVPPLVAGVITLAIGIWRLPFGRYEFSVVLNPAGTVWILVGAAMAALGSLAAVRAAARASRDVARPTPDADTS